MLSQGTYCKGTSCMWETFAFLPNLEYFVILSLQFWPTRFAVLVPPPVITKVQYTRAWVAIVPIQLERHSNLKKYGPPSSNFQVYAHWVITQPTGATGVWNTTVKAASYRPTWFHRMAQSVYPLRLEYRNNCYKGKESGHIELLWVRICGLRKLLSHAL